MLTVKTHKQLWFHFTLKDKLLIFSDVIYCRDRLRVGLTRSVCQTDTA